MRSQFKIVIKKVRPTIKAGRMAAVLRKYRSNVLNPGRHQRRINEKVSLRQYAEELDQTD